MGHPVQVQSALIVQPGASCDLTTVQPQLGVLTECWNAAHDSGGTGEQLRVLVVVEEVELDQAVYFIAKLGCSLDAFLCRGVGKGLTSASTFPHEPEAERAIVDVDPRG
ncbi:hypothetical protein D3C72_1295150 [compost metagenome]